MEETGMNYLWSARKRNALGLPWTFTKYAFTEDRLFVTTGLLKTVEDEVRLYRILNLVNVKNPVQVKEQLSKLIEENRDKKRVTNREYMHDDLEDDDEQ